MAIIDSRGFVDDGSPGLTIAPGGVASIPSVVMTPVVLAGSGSAGTRMVSIPGPGFYQVPVSGSSEIGQGGAGGFTGSLPNPASFPGGSILITDSLGLWSYVVSGSITLPTTVTTGSAFAGGMTSVKGTHLTVPAGGSVGFWSDSKGWIVNVCSGTIALTTVGP